MRFLANNFLLYGAVLVLMTAPVAAAQGDGDLNSQGGLEAATPTDNVNELGGGANAAGGRANSSVDDFPASDHKDEFDVGGGNAGGGDGLFDDGSVDIGGGSGGNAVSAFGDDSNAAAKAAADEKKPAAKAAKPVNAVPLNPVPANPVPTNPAPTNALPGNVPTNTPPTPPSPPPAAVPAAAPVKESPQNNANNNANANEAKDGDANAALNPAAPGELGIKAPPLPPPNEFSGAPPVPGTMRQMADGEAPEEYLVQPGDTLFDICDQLLDEATYWPKLWALNPDIKNPHFIFPNMKLRFYPGDDETPPYLQVVAEDDVIPIDKGDLDERELVAEKVIYPGDGEAGMAEGNSIEVIGPESVDALQEEILMLGRRYDSSELKLQVPGFIYGEEKESQGVVVSGREGEYSAGPETQVLVEGTAGLTNGTLYTVLRRGEKVENPDGDRVGEKYYFVGNVRIKKAIDDALYLGVVDGPIRLTVEPEDILVNYISTFRTIPSGSHVGSLASKAANVVGFQYEGQSFEGEGHYVFLDKGNSDGISAGMYLPIYQSPGYMASEYNAIKLPDDFEQIAVIRIIDTTDAGACGYVVRNSKEIRVGDRTHKG